MKNSENKNKIFAYALFAIVLFIWGTCIIVNKISLNAYSPAIMIGCRSVIASVVLFLFAIPRLKKIDKSLIKAGILIGIFSGLGYLFQLIGLNYTTPVKNGFYEYTSIIFVPVFLVILTRVKQHFIKWISCAVCIVGIVVMSFGETGLSQLSEINLGDALSALAGLFYGINIVITSIFCKDKDPFLLTLFRFIIITIMSLSYAFIFEEVAFSLQFKDIAVLLYLGVFATAVCWLLRVVILKHIDSNIYSVASSFSAVINTIFSIVLGFDKISLSLILGGTIIFTAIILSSFGDIKQTNLKNKFD